ncbi:MAG: hypothetical protein J6C33_02165 [Lachnospiraceae bacterium]|nr:hypothetical protein [Lachnospiraceae bacterium]
MNRKVLSAFFTAAALLIGSGMTAFAEETPAEAAPEAMPVQTYQQMMTPEILASFDRAPYVESDEEAYAIMRNAVLLRTDFGGELLDADGNGIDDRDLVNGCGYIDINCNALDDRFEIALLGGMQADQELTQADVELLQSLLNMISHRCPHGITASRFAYDETLGCYFSYPDYLSVCPKCSEELEETIEGMLSLFMR